MGNTLFSIPTLLSFLFVVPCYSLFAPQIPLFSPLSSNPSCSNPPLSCHKTSEVDKCCYDDSLFLLTQFWNYYPAIGPNETFTLHGLWPDRCDGLYEQFCDNSMNIKNATQILESFGATELLEKMKTYWLNINHDEESLWLHEWNKHATCIDTIKQGCYAKPYPYQRNVVDYFNVTVNLFERLPTFDWLAEAGISPSLNKTYTKEEVTRALTTKFGATPFIKCNRFNAIQEIWYFHSSRGPLLREDFVPIDSLLAGDCPETGIKFYPKGSLGREPPNRGGAEVGYVKLSNQDGCLIRNGRWFIGGSCAQYTLEKAPFGGHNLKTRAGYCGLDQEGALSCGRKVQKVQFQYDKESGKLGLNGKDVWGAQNRPKLRKHVGVFPGGGNIEFELIFEKRSSRFAEEA